MKEERSIYEYIEENVGCSGKIGRSFKLERYLVGVNSKDYEYDKKKVYGYEDDFEKFYKEESDLINNIDFPLYKAVEELIDKLDSNIIEAYLRSKNIGIPENLAEIINVIERKEENIDKKKLTGFCKENILTTKNMNCMYVYLILSKYANLKEDKRLQTIILKVALAYEFTQFVNCELLDNFPNPDYVRFFLAKRVDNMSDKLSLISKIKLKDNEIRKWIVTAILPKVNYDSRAIDVVLSVDIPDILKSWNIDAKTYAQIGQCLCASNYGIIRNEDFPQNTFSEIILEFSNSFYKYADDIRAFKSIASIYREVKVVNVYDEKNQKILLENLRKNILNETTINTIKDIVKNVKDDEQNTYIYSELISALEIEELELMIYNVFKEDPVSNVELIGCFESKKELLLSAVKKLYDAIKWEDIIGKYQKEGDSYPAKEVYFLINYASEFPQFVQKVYAKALRAKNFETRRRCLSNLLKQNYYDFDEDVTDALKDLVKNEPSVWLRTYAKELLDMEDDENIDLKSAMYLNYTSEEEREYEKKKKNKYEDLDLKEKGIFYMFLEDDEFDDALNSWIDGKLLYLDRVNDELFGYCQGDNFGEEYTVKLKIDDKYILKKASCTCEKYKETKACKHIDMLITHISKCNDENIDILKIDEHIEKI